MIIGALIFKKKHIANSLVSNVGTHNEFVGITGIITIPPSSHREGEVELGEQILGNRRWPALYFDGDIEIGTDIKIVEVRGNTLVIEKN